MNMQISFVPFGTVVSVISGLVGYFYTAAKWSRGRANPDDIIRACLNGVYQLWVVHDDTKLYGFFATEVKQYPQVKMLCVQHCVIEPNRMAEVEDQMQTIAERYAKDSGCAGIEFVGRPGWKRHAGKYGYKTQSVMYQRFFAKDE